MNGLFVGVDGGGSNTRVLVVDEQGAELATAEGPGSAIRPGATSHSASVIRDAVHRACAGLTDRPIRAICVGVAGAGREEERDTLLATLDADRIAGTVVVVTDAEIAIEDAFGAGPGVLLTAGTGSIAYGKGPTGVMARCGGWGPVIGDEGGGAWIGRRALGIVAASSDGREPETTLGDAILLVARSRVHREAHSVGRGRNSRGPRQAGAGGARGRGHGRPSRELAGHARGGRTRAARAHAGAKAFFRRARRIPTCHARWP